MEENAVDKTSAQPSSSAGEERAVKRKRHNRRAKKRKHRRGPEAPIAEGSTTQDDGTGLEPVSGSNSSAPLNVKRGCHKHLMRPNPAVRFLRGRRTKGKRSAYVLRPTMGPLLNAPKNSTQYIIDDHVEDGDSDADNFDSDPSEGGKMVYFEKDFQTVYESAHREEVEQWDRSELIREISDLEKRQKELIALLSRLDPEVYLQRLQSRVTTMVERNRLLKTQLKLNNATTSKSPTTRKEGSDGEGGSG